MPKNGQKYKRKKSKRKNNKTMVRRNRLPTLGGYPTSKKVRLRYATTVSLNPSAGQVVKHQFSANSMFDPDVSGTGHQPRYYDQWMSSYNHYNVVSSKITVTPCGPSASFTGNTVQFGLTLSPDGLFPWTTWTDLAESRFAGAGNRRAKNYEQSKPVTKYFSAKKYFGASAIVGALQYQGAISSAPSEIANFQLWATNAEGSDDPPETTFMVIIDYIAVLTEPRYVAGS